MPPKKQLSAGVDGQNASYSVVFSALSFNSTSTPNSTSAGNGNLYLGIGAGAAIGAIAASIGTMFYTGTGFFRKP